MLRCGETPEGHAGLPDLRRGIRRVQRRPLGLNGVGDCPQHHLRRPQTLGDRVPGRGIVLDELLPEPAEGGELEPNPLGLVQKRPKGGQMHLISATRGKQVARVDQRGGHGRSCGATGGRRGGGPQFPIDDGHGGSLRAKLSTRPGNRRDQRFEHAAERDERADVDRRRGPAHPAAKHHKQDHVCQSDLGAARSERHEEAVSKSPEGGERDEEPIHAAHRDAGRRGERGEGCRGQHSAPLDGVGIGQIQERHEQGANAHDQARQRLPDRRADRERHEYREGILTPGGHGDPGSIHIRQTLPHRGHRRGRRHRTSAMYRLGA